MGVTSCALLQLQMAGTAVVIPLDEELVHMKKSVLIIVVLVAAGFFAFSVGVRGGWTVGKTYFESKDQREASR